MKPKLLLLAAAAALAVPAAAQAQMRALSDPVVPHPDPESLFTSSDPVLHRNKQAALHIQRDLLKCNHWNRAGEWLTDRYIQHNPFAASGLEGVVRLILLVAYIWAIGFMPDVRRLFGYHGAEHKTINAYEAGAELVGSMISNVKI